MTTFGRDPGWLGWRPPSASTVMVPVSVEMLPQAFDGRWIECDRVRFVARMDGTYNIEFHRCGTEPTA